MYRLTLVLASTLLGAIGVAAQPAAGETPVTVSLCDLAENPGQFHGRTVRVRGTYRSAFEASAFEDARCVDRRVWVTFAASSETATAPRVLRRWNRAFEQTDRHPCDNAVYMPAYSVDVTFVALFDGVKPSTTVHGRTYTYGFGHLNAYDYQLTVLSIERVGRSIEHGGAALPAPATFTVNCEMLHQLPL